MTVIANYETMRASWGTGAIDTDGREVWPINSIRANGFTTYTGPIGFFALPYPLYVSVTDDAVYGVHEYEWYLSQRTDDPAKQWLSLEHTNPARSALVGIYATQLLIDERGLAGSVSAAVMTVDDLPVVAAHAHIYVKRLSDGAIQCIPLDRLFGLTEE